MVKLIPVALVGRPRNATTDDQKSDRIERGKLPERDIKQEETDADGEGDEQEQPQALLKALEEAELDAACAIHEFTLPYRCFHDKVRLAGR